MVGNGEEPGIGIVQGIGKDPKKPLSEYWGDAVAAAANTLRAEDEPGEFQVTTYVYVKTSSPGWIDGFRVKLT